MVWVNELHYCCSSICFRALRFFFFQAEDGIRDGHVTGVQTCALPISSPMLAERERISFGEALRRAEEAPGIATRSLNAVRTFVSMLDDLQEQARSGEGPAELRSEEHTSELQSRGQLVCRLLLEKKNNRSL